MLPKCARVIKSDQMKMDGIAHIEPAGGAVVFSEAAGAVQQVRIIESHDSHAVLELICSCGCKSRVQCNYGTA